MAPVYLRLGRFDDAVNARRKILRVNGETAERQADLGEALVAAANGLSPPRPRRLSSVRVALDAQ